MEVQLLIVLHVLGATVWVGGHLVVALGVVPEALRRRDSSLILAFEKRFERIGLPALLVQIATGLWLGSIFSEPARWFAFADRAGTTVGVKLLLLAATLALAVHAKTRVLPRLTDDRLGVMAAHIVAVTVIAVVMLVVGLNFRLGIW